MSRPVMYKSKPVNTACKIESVPNVMYKMRSIYDSIDLPKSAENVEQTSTDGSLSIENLSKDCNSQMRRLSRLQDKVNQFCEDISLSYLIPAEKKNLKSATSSQENQPELFPGRVTEKKNKKGVEDIVINVSSGSMPYGILVAFGKLATKYKSFMQFFVHGSAMKEANSKRINAVKALFSKLKLDLLDSRSSYDYGVNLIWKKLADEKLGAVLTLNSTTKIYGESNIIRFIHRLYDTKLSLDRDLDVMDQCTNELVIGQQQTAYLTRLNTLLSKSQRRYLTFGEQPGDADFYVWSVLKQLKDRFDEKQLSKVSEWMKVVEASMPMAQMISTF